jgi:ADP-heptose:LPS heptosyltransferase
MIIDKTRVNRMLLITLTNIGDIILTTPVIRALKKEFPDSRLDILVGPKGREIFELDPAVFKLIIYDKHIPISEKRRLQIKLKKLKYDLVVDLRNTVFPLLIGPKFRTSTIQRFPKEVIHSRKKHLHRLKSLGMENPDDSSYIYIPEGDDAHISGLLDANKISGPIVAINPGAMSHIKRWEQEGFAEVADRLSSECGASVIFIGADNDRDVVSAVTSRMSNRFYDFVGKTNIRQLAALLKRSKLLLTNDSAPLHLGCAVGLKVLAIFGPTDPRKYGPTGELDCVMSNKLHCAPCESAACKYNHECMKLISPEEVFNTAKMMLEGYE